MLLRDAKVFARCDEAGELVTQGGKVEIRYNSGVGKAYHAAPANLVPVASSVLRPDSDFSAAQPMAASAERAGTRPGGGTRVAHARSGGSGGSSAPTHAEPGEVVAYADGACSGNPGPAGLGVVLLTHDARRELSEFIGVGTNNIAELLGIQRAAEAFPPEQRILRVYTDSTYAIGVLSKGWKAKANIELIAATKAALSRVPAWELHHVRGHHGVPLNERADQLAVAAVEARRSAGWTFVTAK